MKITHIITGLRTGGAEILLARLAEQLQARGHIQQVVSLGPPGEVAARIRAAGIPVLELGARGGKDIPAMLWRLWRFLRKERPDVVQTWMYHADVLGGMVARIAGIPVSWGIHHTTMDAKEDKRSTRLLVKLASPLSWILPDAIVCCAYSSASVHEAFGYAPARMHVVPNGTDVGMFSRDAAAASRFRRACGLAPGARLVGWAGRNHAQKDPENFVRAAAMLVSDFPDVVFLMAGSGMDAENTRLIELARETGLGDRLRLLGRCSDMQGFYAALDVFVLSAVRGEAMPLVVGEAMAAETPCVVTDVGDAWRLVGETGTRVPASSSVELAAGISGILRLGPEARMEAGILCRRRITEKYSLDTMTDGYLDVWSSVLSGRGEG